MARDPRTTYLGLALYRNAALSGSLLPTLVPVAGKPLHFKLDGIEVAPFFEGTEDPTHVYFHRVEPKIIFGNLDSGVMNPARSDGTTFLDEVWAGAPFTSQRTFVQAVDAKVKTWVAAGRLDASDGAVVVRTAKLSRLKP